MDNSHWQRWWTTLLTLCVASGISGAPSDPVSFVSFKGAHSISSSEKNETIIRLGFEVTKGYHIQSNVEDESQTIPTVLSFQPSKSFVIGKINFPATETFRLEGTEVDLDVFSGFFQVTLPLKRTTAIMPGKQIVHGKLSY